MVAPPEPVNDLESVMAVTRANAANGYPWDLPLVLVVYGVLRAFGTVRAALLGPRTSLTPVLRSSQDRHDREGT